jgi:hypothetical protein
MLFIVRMIVIFLVARFAHLLARAPVPVKPAQPLSNTPQEHLHSGSMFFLAFATVQPAKRLKPVRTLSGMISTLLARIRNAIAVIGVFWTQFAL